MDVGRVIRRFVAVPIFDPFRRAPVSPAEAPREERADRQFEADVIAWEEAEEERVA
jgi:hypothetical protein